MTCRRKTPLSILLTSAFAFRVGNGMARLALPWFVLAHTGSGAWAGAAAASSVVATIVGAWLGGGLVDRFGGAPVALLSGVVGGIATAAIPLLHFMELLSPEALLACVMLGAAFDAPGMAAQDSHLPVLGRKAGLSVERISSLKAVISHAAFLGGPALGGAAVGVVGAAATLWFTAGCSLAAGLLAVGVLPVRRPSDAPAVVGLSLSEGTKFVWKDPLLRPLFGVAMLFTGIAGANGAVILPALFQDVGRPAAELGLFSSAMGAGGLVGIAAHAWIGHSLLPHRWLAVSFSAFAAATTVLCMVPGLPMLLVIGAFVGMMTGPVSPILNAAIYNRTPPELMGRVLGAISALMLSASPAVMVAAGALVDWAGPRYTLVASSAACMGIALSATSLRYGAATAKSPQEEDGRSCSKGVR